MVTMIRFVNKGNEELNMFVKDEWFVNQSIDKEDLTSRLLTDSEFLDLLMSKQILGYIHSDNSWAVKNLVNGYESFWKHGVPVRKL